MRYLSVCSGIEAASVAWKPLGWEAVAFSEIEKFPSAVLAHHYPNVPNWGDMTKFKDWPDATVDLLVGGTPCQSFSVAGLRKGMADPRGNLALTFLAIADRYRPEWLVWENVPGVLSSNGGRDFGSILGGMVELGYGVCYRVLDAQYFGVAQRRRRVFVVGHAGDWHRAAAVLLEPEGLRGDSAPRREAGKGTARGVEIGPSGGRFTDLNPTLDARAKDGPIRNQLAGCVAVPEVVGSLTDGAHNGGGLTGRTPTAGESSLYPDIVRQAMSAKWAKGTSGPAGDEVANLVPVRTGGGFDVAHSLRADGFDAGEDGTGRGTPLVPVAFAQNQRDEVRAVAGDLAAEPGMKQQTYIAIQNATRGQDQNGLGIAAPGEPMFTLDQGSQHAIAIQGAATRENPTSGPDGVGVSTADTAYTLEARQEVQAVGFHNRQDPDVSGDVTHPLGAKDNGLGLGLGLGPSMQVRRLTPRECERLQGFPDDYTLIPHGRSRKFMKGIEGAWGGDKKLAADGPRYKALGNSMAVPVMRWIGERIQAVEQLQPEYVPHP